MAIATAKWGRLGPDICRMIIVANTWWLADFAAMANYDQFPQVLFQPQFLFLPFQTWPLSPATLVVVFQVLLALLFIGFGGRWIPLATAAVGAFLFGWRYNFGFFHWADATLITSIWALGMCPWYGPASVDGWWLRKKPMDLRNLDAHIFVFRFLSVFPFFAAGISKLRATGFDWAAPENIKLAFLFNRELFIEWFSPASLEHYDHLLTQPLLLGAVGYITLAAELGSPLAFYRRLRVPVLVTLLTFLILLKYIYRHDFLATFWPAFLFWLPWRQYWPLSSKSPGVKSAPRKGAKFGHIFR